MQLKPDVEAIFEFVGSRKDKLYEGYRPAHLIHENYLISGVHSYYNLEADTDKDLRGTKWSTVREDFNVNRGSVGNNQQNGKN